MDLGGACFTIGLWFDQPVFPSVLLAVGDVLVAGGGRYEGDVTVGPSDAVFAGGYDIRGYRSLDSRVVEGTMAGTVEGTVYGLRLRLPGAVGPASVGFATTPAAVPAQEHPVEIDMAADMLLFCLDDLDRKDRKQAKARERALLRRMKAVCAALDPAYAVVRVESGDPSPAPAVLAAGTEGLGSSAFVSHRLATRPALVAPIAALALLCKTQDWGTGTQYEWGPARADRERGALIAADRAVSLAVGRLLATR
ncbi:MAG TPA: hypothetical protein VLL08_19500 [Kineosporiaceae bacterium]|nr:hypothetical protein [Kineosporiaceae bacterium]